MSSFCTSCGNAMRGSAFCTSCGAVQNVVSSDSSAVSAVDTSVVLQTSDQQLPPEESSYGLQLSEDSEPKGKKKVLVIAAIVLLFIGGASGAFFAGKSSIDLKKERKISYDLGYESGESIGDSAGYSRGYDAGEEAGCRKVFSFSDGEFDYITPYNPYNYFNRYPGTKYYAKYQC